MEKGIVTRTATECVVNVNSKSINIKNIVDMKFLSENPVISYIDHEKLDPHVLRVPAVFFGLPGNNWAKETCTYFVGGEVTDYGTCLLFKYVGTDEEFDPTLGKKKEVPNRFKTCKLVLVDDAVISVEIYENKKQNTRSVGIYYWDPQVPRTKLF